MLTGLFGCGGGSSAPTNTTPTAPTTQTPTTPPDTPAAGVTIVSGARTLGSQAYSPNPLTVNAGTTVTWTNGDTSTHGAVNDGGAFNSGGALYLRSVFRSNDEPADRFVFIGFRPARTFR